MPRVRKLRSAETNGMQTALKLPPAREEHLDIGALEQWLWDAACIIRGATDAPKFKDFILPLVFYKRLSDVYDDEVEALAAQFGDRATANDVIAEDHADALRSGRPPIVRFYLINASRYFRKEKPKNVLTDEGIAAAAGVYHTWETRPKLSRVVTLAELRKADYNLSPSQFVEWATARRIVTSPTSWPTFGRHAKSASAPTRR